MKYWVAYDIGGTNCRIALVSQKFKILDFISEKTARSESGLLAQSAGLFKKLLDKNSLNKDQVMSCGISYAGALKPDGIVVKSPNLPIKKGADITKFFSKKLGKKVFVLNDMKCVALGELNFGAAKGLNNVVCITISTGIGSGIVTDGKLYFGAHNAAGEIGSNFMYDRDFEFYGSGKGLEFEYKKVTGKKLNARDIQKLAESGNKTALAAFKKSAESIGLGVASVVQTLDPEVVIFSGSHIVRGWDLLMPTVRKIINRHSIVPPKIIKTKLGRDAAILGAVKWASDNL